MSSPAGLHFSQADFLARWMPSSTRAGVILNPCPDLAGSLRHTPAVEAPSPGPDDSFVSDFSPLPASADSSCLGVDGFAPSPGGEGAGTDRPVNGQSSAAQRKSDGGSDSLDEMADKANDLPLTMKLEQLRKWQQHMQEQLKAHQLEELLQLQDEHQKLLGFINRSQHSTGALLDSREDDDDEEQSADTDCEEHNDTLMSTNGMDLTKGESGMEEYDGSMEDTVFHDRPVGGHKKTFDELLEEQLMQEEQRLSSAKQQQNQDGGEASQAPPKRAFLRRGEGLSRFTNNHKASLPKKELKMDPKQQVQTRGMSRSKSEPTAILRGSTNSGQRLPVHRKTTTLNKENQLKGVRSAPRDIGGASKAVLTKVLGSHQRQNTDGSGSVQSDPEGTQDNRHHLGQAKEPNDRIVGPTAPGSRKPGQNTQLNPVTKEVGVVRLPEKVEEDAAGEKSCESGVELAEGTTVSGGGGGGDGDGVPLDSFELSLQEKLQRLDCARHLESMELGEFELLEQAAEELSFSSNSSFVMKVLQLDQLKAGGGLLPRRLSSTPIKSPPGCAVRRISSGGAGGAAAGRSSGSLMLRGDELRKRVSAEDEEGGKEDRHGNSDVSSCSGTECEDQEVLVQPSVFPSTLCFPAQSNPPYDRRSYQDRDDRRDSASNGTGGDDGESDIIISDTDESTFTEDNDGQLDHVVFDDNDTWTDLEDTAVAAATDIRGVSAVTAHGVPPPERTLTRKVAASKAVEMEKSTAIGSTNQEPDPPPASQLMKRLFPSLKPKAQNAPLPPPAAASVVSESKKSEVETGQHVQSRMLRERLVELEIEIERFKKENAALAKLRQENEMKQENLRKERLEFEETKAEELANFEEYKKEENRKLQKERKLFEKHASAARAIPDKKEREEIQVLKQQLSSLQEELRGRESRWASAQNRTRQQIDSLRQENASLQEEISMLEKLRLSAWRKTPVSAEKDKEVKDGARVPENSVTSVIKGVKFACPLDSRRSSWSPPQSCPAAATRRTSRDSSQGSAGAIKSSLKRPSVSGSSSSVTSSSSLPGRKKEERSTPATKSQDKPPKQENPNNGPVKREPLPKEPESSETKEPEPTQEVITHTDGKIEKVLAGGDRIISFPNGTKKEVSADGLTVKVTFFNGDTKQITADQRVIYYYAEAQTTHITYPDGMEVLHFSNNQTEKHFPDGRKEITFPDQTVKHLFPDGREESVLMDGTIIRVNPDGTKEIHFNTGQKEIHTADYKRREYPDGTVKTVYADGRQETHYPSGRLRVKDKDGYVITDRM